EMPRAGWFCTQALLTGGSAMVVPNAATDPRFHDKPFVVGAPHLRFFAGVWLTAPNGLPIGTLCVLDRVPRGLPDPPQIAALTGHAQAISEAGRHMLTLVNDILEFSRLEAGEISIAWRQVPLPRIVEEALRMVSAFARSRDVRLRQEVAWPDCMVRGDPVRLK